MCAQPVNLGSRMLVGSPRRRCACSPELQPCSGGRRSVVLLSGEQQQELRQVLHELLRGHVRKEVKSYRFL